MNKLLQNLKPVNRAELTILLKNLAIIPAAILFDKGLLGAMLCLWVDISVKALLNLPVSLVSATVFYENKSSVSRFGNRLFLFLCWVLIDVVLFPMIFLSFLLIPYYHSDFLAARFIEEIFDWCLQYGWQFALLVLCLYIPILKKRIDEARAEQNPIDPIMQLIVGGERLLPILIFFLVSGFAIAAIDRLLHPESRLVFDLTCYGELWRFVGVKQYVDLSSFRRGRRKG